MRDEWSIDPDRGLWLFRASRLEALLDPLEALLTHLPPAELLAPQTVLVGHPGLRPWLWQALAARRGPRGIVTGLELALPGPWLDGLAQSLLGLPPAAARVWQRELLRWRLLPQLAALDDARLQPLLADDDGTRAFMLAERLSAALAPLMLYRSDWLQRWACGKSAVRGDALLASAWRILCAGAAAQHPHRGERLRQLAHLLQTSQTRPKSLASDPLHVFGLHHLAPPELAVLRALSRWRPVVLHVADPCREHWLGMGAGRAAMREAMNREDVGEADFLALDHPLLAAWGRLGQHFLLALEDEILTVNERHGIDTLDVAPRNLLEGLQSSLRRNEPRAMQVDAAGFAALHDDASLRVQRCATPLRELEVLREALAEAFANLPDLQPSEVVVLSPDPARYRPLLPAVFGEPARRDGVWPWYAADVPLAALHPVCHALAQALTLAGTRLSAPVVLDLLAHPVLAQRFGLEGQAEGPLRQALARLGVAWGFDGRDRERFGAPDTEANTFAWGLDRALAGHVFGTRDAEPISLPDGERLLPGESIDAGLADTLGRLHALLLELRDWAALGEACLPPKDWVALLKRRIDGLFKAAPGDDATRDALDTVHGLVAELGEEWREATLQADLRWAVVRAALQAKLATVPERQRFLLGGITFCGMVPQRAIPFRVIAVLGLDEAALPRHAPDDGFDLRARAPRVGDRDLASDDRYLFLETLMAARDRLHLSFIGIGAHDGRPRNPAGPLADLMEVLARFVPPPGTARPESGWPWERQAALQPPGLLATRPEAMPWRPPALNRTETAPSPNSAPVGGNAAATAAGSAAAALPSLDALIAFFRDPAKQALRDEAGVRLDALEDDPLDDSEPLIPKADPREAMARGLVFACLEQAAAAPPEAPDEALRLGGRLPPGVLGEHRWREQRELALETLAALRAAEPAPAEPLSPPRRLPIDIALGDGTRLAGPVEVREDADGVLWLIEAAPKRDPAQLHFGRRVPLLLRWLALRLAQAKPLRVALVGRRADGLGARLAARDAAFLAATDDAARAPQVAEFQRALRAALDFRAAVLRGERRYAPATSWAAWQHAEEDPGKIAAAWIGDARVVGERDHAPGYAALWRQDWYFVPGDGEVEAFVAGAQALRACFGALLDAGDDNDASSAGDPA